MAKISISDVLKKRRRFRIVTFFACLILVLVFGQLVLISGGKKTNAAANWDINDATNTCRLLATRSPGGQYSIPARCEGHDILIDGAITVYSDDILIWQGNRNSHYECPPTYPGDSSYVYNSISGSTCKYLKYVSVTDTQTMIAPYAYCPYSWWFYVGGQYVAYSLVSQTTFQDAYKRTKYQCTYSNTVSAPSWKTYAAKSVQDVKGQDCTVPQYSGYQIDPSQYSECDSKREFNSLQLLDGAGLTHNPIDPSEMNGDTTGNGSLADETTGSGRFKKVDLIIDDKVKLASNSSINVDKAGYPASSSTATKGYGIGGGGTVIGNGCARGSDQCLGGGAGYGGVGYAGSGSGSVGGAIVNNNQNILNDSDFEWGSAGGYSRQLAPGGHGGGRIRLVVAGTFEMSDDSSISANGENGQNTGDPHGSFGGAGSGGTIKITMSKYIGNNSPRISAAATGYVLDNGSYTFTKNSLRGTATLVNLGSNGSAGPTIYSDGGFSSDGTGAFWAGGGNPNFLGSGSGGRIYIEQTGQGVSVKKVLEPVRRADGATSFNPYALQMGDTIEVDIWLGHFTGTISLTDDFLKQLGTTTPAICKWNGTNVSPAVSGHDNSTISWSLDSSYSDGAKKVYYYCVVQQ